jgi:hypothetical protein
VKEKMYSHIINDPSLKSLAYNLAQNDSKDLLQELALIICEKTDEELAKIDSYFNFWCVRTLVNMCGKRGNFTKLYKAKTPDINELRYEYELSYDSTKDELLEKIDEILGGIYWYKRDLFKLYFELGNYRAVEEEVDIDHVSVYNTVRDVKNHIKDNL